MADWQNLDPEAAREAEKYENPIPSRELILAHLSERGAPATRSQLLDEFGLAGEEPEEALRRRLRATTLSAYTGGKSQELKDLTAVDLDQLNHR